MYKPKWKELNNTIAWQYFQNLLNFWIDSGLQNELGAKDCAFCVRYLQNLKKEDVFKIFSKDKVYNSIKYLKFNVLEPKKALIKDEKKQGQVAVYKASKYGSVKVLKVLKNAGADFTPTFFSQDYMCQGAHIHETAFNGHVKALKYLLTCNISVNCKSGSKYATTPLEQAARNNQYEIMEILLEFGANPKDLSKKKHMPLAAKYAVNLEMDTEQKRELIVAANKANLTCIEYISLALREKMDRDHLKEP